MALIDVKATVNIGGVRAMLSRMARIDVKATFMKLRAPARLDQNKHWRADQAPDGKWPPLAASTRERRLRARGRDKKGRNRSWPKKLLGRFPTSMQTLASKKSLIVRSRVKRFSMVHQAGGRAGHGAYIPRRQYMWISAQLKAEAVKTFKAALARAARGS